MTAVELQQRLAAMPSRAAQTLAFRCLDGRTPAECAALYGIALAQWELLFLDAARLFAGETAPLPDSGRAELSSQLQQALAGGGTARGRLVEPLEQLSLHRDEIRRLTAEAELAAESSPARARETWLRRVAVVLIIAASIYVWLRDKDKPPETPGRSRTTSAR